ncbi:MAG: hypothetical protein B7Z80_12440 [Rhodospirillales bacterium 20-64-7]|nr:MAG: hypothetical protein B7Z80_12440 [Rhodospirillales bacterium 20-64-7]HQT75720.1 transglycosylase SLT domain-containing protein [Rhodopila sp.]
MPIRIPTPTIGRYAPDPQVVSAVRNASLATGTQFDTLMASAALESGLNPAAKANSSSASGLFQFTEQTWLSTMRQYGAAHGLQADAAAIVSQGGALTVSDPVEKQRILNLRFDPTVSATMAGDHLKNLAATLSARLGRLPDAAETYLAHFLGSAGATQMLQAAQVTPNMPAASVLPDAARANPAAFNMPDGTPRTAVQFVQHIRDRVAKAFMSLGAPAPSGALTFATPTTPSGTAAVASGSISSRGLALAHASVTPSERAMADTLVTVFTRLDQSESPSRTSHAKRDHLFPLGIVSALAATDGTQVSGS